MFFEIYKDEIMDTWSWVNDVASGDYTVEHKLIVCTAWEELVGRIELARKYCADSKDVWDDIVKRVRAFRVLFA